MSFEHPTSEQPAEEPESPRPILRLQHVICKSGLILLEGTLSLTQDQLNLVDARQIRDRIDARYLDGESLTLESSEANATGLKGGQSIPAVSIPIENIESMTFELVLGKPSLFLKWEDMGKAFAKTRKIQFIQRGQSSFSDGQRLSRWIPVIDELSNKDGAIAHGKGDQDTREDVRVARVGSPSSDQGTIGQPDMKKLEERVLGVLDQREWKGLFQIVKDMRDQYGSDFDFDEVEAVCRKLVQRKLLQEDSVGAFYKKA